MYLAIDPGLRKLAWALLDGATGRLVRAGLAEHGGRDRDARQWLKIAHAFHRSLPLTGFNEITTVAYEMPQIYKESDNVELRRATGARLKNAKNPDNLLQLAGVLGACLAPFAHARLVGYRPRQWKRAGQAKAESHAGVMRVLDVVEQALLHACLAGVDPSMHHDVMDAIAIGLVAAKRTTT